MSKSRSELAFGKALRDVDQDVPTYVYRPPDVPNPSSRKPCDFMVWSLSTYDPATSSEHFVDVAWFECKQLAKAVAESFPFRLIEPSQRQGIRTAKRIGIDYWLAIYWQRHEHWTISDAVRLEATGMLDTRSISRTLLMTRFGIDTEPAHLMSTLKGILAGEVR